MKILSYILHGNLIKTMDIKPVNDTANLIIYRPKINIIICFIPIINGIGKQKQLYKVRTAAAWPEMISLLCQFFICQVNQLRNSIAKITIGCTSSNVGFSPFKGPEKYASSPNVHSPNTVKINISFETAGFKIHNVQLKIYRIIYFDIIGFIEAQNLGLIIIGFWPFLYSIAFLYIYNPISVIRTTVVRFVNILSQ